METRRGPHVRARAWALLLTLGLLAFAFIGRAVTSADDGAEMMADTLGFLVQGRFESATLPEAVPDRFLPPLPPFRSRYGVVASMVPLPFVGAAWPFRRALGAPAVDAIASLTWATGALLAALAFLRLARALDPRASPLWVPAFLGGTFLWAYVADSYVEPWAAAALALSAAGILGERDSAPARAAFAVAAPAVFAFLLRTIAWTLAPVLVLAALLAWRGRPDGPRRVAWLFAFLAAGLLGFGLLNLVRHGSMTDFGYGPHGPLPFVHSPLLGFVQCTILPGRGVFFYAPIVLAALAMARRLSWPARVLCVLMPLVLLLVASRWFIWHGGSSWGPRFLLPALPLLAAPAVLAPRRVAAALLLAGALVNLPGVLVAAGAYQGYAEKLLPPPGATWPAGGGDRVSEIAALTPLYGHPWLLASALAKRPIPAPWLSAGARETMAPPPLAGFLSPWIVRRASRLPAISPFLPRLLVRSAVAYLRRGRPEQSARFARAALSLDPRERDAPRILAGALAARAAP